MTLMPFDMSPEREASMLASLEENISRGHRTCETIKDPWESLFMLSQIMECEDRARELRQRKKVREMVLEQGRAA